MCKAITTFRFSRDDECWLEKMNVCPLLFQNSGGYVSGFGKKKPHLGRFSLKSLVCGCISCLWFLVLSKSTTFKAFGLLPTTMVVLCLLIFDGVLSCVVVLLFMVLRFVDPSFWICDWLSVILCIKTFSLPWFLVMVLFGSKAPMFDSHNIFFCFVVSHPDAGLLGKCAFDSISFRQLYLDFLNTHLGWWCGLIELGLSSPIF